MIYVIGIGPGNINQMTYEARNAIENAEVVIGYKTYIDLILPILEGKQIYSNGMRGEVTRCKQAVELSQNGKHVAVISSGDSGVYGMAGLIYELVDHPEEVVVIPGITASIAGAALLGAPLMHDFCHISLSDLLTPFDVIMNRVKAAAQADFVICFYNPRSHGRPNHLKAAIEIIMSIQGIDVWVGIAKDIGRENEMTHIMPISEIDYTFVDMTTLVFVGNKSTFLKERKLVTPRGYHL